MLAGLERQDWIEDRGVGPLQRERVARLRTLHIRTPQASASVQDPVRTAEFTHTHSEPAFPREFQEFLRVAVPGPDLIGITILGHINRGNWFGC